MLEATRHRGHAADMQSIAMRQILLAQNASMSKHICISGWSTWIMIPLPRHLPAAFCCFNWEWYMCEDQVAGKGVGVGLVGGLKGRNQFPSAWSATPRGPQRLPDHSWGLWRQARTHTWPWNETRRDGMCAFSHDDWHDSKIWWISELVSNTWIKTMWKHFKTQVSLYMCCWTPSFYWNRYNEWALHCGVSNYKIKNKLFLSYFYYSSSKLALLCALLWGNQDNYCKGQLESNQIILHNVHSTNPLPCPLMSTSAAVLVIRVN